MSTIQTVNIKKPPKDNVDKVNTRLGYACINMSLKEHKICCNRTCRLATAINQGVQTGYPQGSLEYSISIYRFLTTYGRNNLTAMFKIISWSRKHGIYFYRMSSDMFPHICNPRIQEHMLPEHWKVFTELTFARDIIDQIGKYAQKYQIRLTMHPGHFNQLGSPNDQVVANTVTDLTWHTRLLDMLSEGAERYNAHLTSKDLPTQENILKHGILCVHGGGTYGNKAETIKRWKTTFKTLPINVQRRLALENDERGYNVQDLLPICQELSIPLIFDFHHYNCWSYYHKNGEDQEAISVLLPQILQTWSIRNMIPKFHLSDQNEDKKVGAHHDYVESIPKELLELIDQDYTFDIMIEAKQKDLAVLKLYNKYCHIFHSIDSEPCK